MDDLDRSIAQRTEYNPDYPRLLHKEIDRQKKATSSTVYRVVAGDEEWVHLATFERISDADAYIRRIRIEDRHRGYDRQTYRIVEEPLWLGVPTPLIGFELPSSPPVVIDADALKHKRFPMLPTDTHPLTRMPPTQR